MLYSIVATVCSIVSTSQCSEIPVAQLPDKPTLYQCFMLPQFKLGTEWAEAHPFMRVKAIYCGKTRIEI